MMQDDLECIKIKEPVKLFRFGTKHNVDDKIKVTFKL